MTRLSVDEAQARIRRFLTRDMVDALRAVDYAAPPLSDQPSEEPLARLARATVRFSHVPGASDCLYRVAAFGDALTLRVQLNVRRFVVTYQAPLAEPLESAVIAPHFERWAIGAGHAGWLIGWRDGTDPWSDGTPVVETYCYASLDAGFLDNPLDQLYWRTDIAQMTRAFMLEARRVAVRLAGDGGSGGDSARRG